MAALACDAGVVGAVQPVVARSARSAALVGTAHGVAAKWGAGADPFVGARLAGVAVAARAAAAVVAALGVRAGRLADTGPVLTAEPRIAVAAGTATAVVSAFGVVALQRAAVALEADLVVSTRETVGGGRPGEGVGSIVAGQARLVGMNGRRVPAGAVDRAPGDDHRQGAQAVDARFGGAGQAVVAGSTLAVAAVGSALEPLALRGTDALSGLAGFALGALAAGSATAVVATLLAGAAGHTTRDGGGQRVFAPGPADGLDHDEQPLANGDRKLHGRLGLDRAGRVQAGVRGTVRQHDQIEFDGRRSRPGGDREGRRPRTRPFEGPHLFGARVVRPPEARAGVIAQRRDAGGGVPVDGDVGGQLTDLVAGRRAHANAVFAGLSVRAVHAVAGVDVRLGVHVVDVRLRVHVDVEAARRPGVGDARSLGHDRLVGVATADDQRRARNSQTWQ